MAKSKRKPYYTQGYKGIWRKYAKRRANKTIRRFKKWIPNGSWFKKLYESWDICDWKNYSPENKKAKRK